MAASFRASPQAPEAYTITLLGSPTLSREGKVVPLARRQMLALLFRLAVALQPVAREQLYFLLWPDIPDEAAHRNLTVLLNQLRQALPVPGALRNQGDAIQLESALFQVDTVAFNEAMEQAARTGDLQPLADAVKLYSGRFLDGFSMPASEEFDGWLAQERRVWERRYLDALSMLVDGYAGRGDYTLAIGAARQALAVDGLAEEVHRRLISLYAMIGDRSAALRQFEECVVVLERELGVSPLPETRAVYEAVRAGKAPARQELARQDPAGQEPVRQEKESSATPVQGALPAPATPLIDREEEVAAIMALLSDPGLRLLTLIGAGGSGKTRLALQAAWNVSPHIADGVIFVALAPVRDPSLLLLAIGQACGLAQSGPGVLVEYLRNRQMLLLLDNCEHLLAAAIEIAALLAAAPTLSILATSRAALNLAGEHTFVVPPLPLPSLARLPAVSDLAVIPSVTLLVARTQALNPRFRLSEENAAESAAICVRLDGLPLAIELAAARLKMLPARDLLRRLDRRLDLLTQGSRDLPERQQTLATIDWSYRLLDVDEQMWFERCSVFVGSWTVAAVEGMDERLRWRVQEAANGGALAPASNLLDVLAALVDKSLVQAHSPGDAETRFTMLETIREYAAERLRERGAGEAVTLAHADYFLSLVEPWNMNAPDFLAKMELELDNLRAALRRFLDHADGADGAMRLSRVMHRFFYWRDWISEGRWWLDQVVVKSAGIHSEGRANALVGAALFAMVQGDFTRTIELHEANLELCKELGLERQRSSSLNALGTVHARQGNIASAIPYFEESLAAARVAGHPEALCTACYMLAGVLLDFGVDDERSLDLYEECLAVARQHKLRVTESMTLSALGIARAFHGDLARAAELLPEALRMQRELNATMALGWTLQYMAILAFLQGDYVTAGSYYAESLEAAPKGGAQYIVPTSLEGIAGVASIGKQPELAARWLGAAQAMRAAISSDRPPSERRLYEQIVQSVREQLPEERFDALWQEGLTLSAEEVIAEASAFP